jgi:hypothetical protein
MHRDDLNGDLRHLIFEFFFRFSRFESALKEHGYRRWTNAGDKASPSWQKFAADHRDTYEPNATAVQLMHAKPMIQVIGDDGDLHFVEEPMADNLAVLDRLIAHAQTVRNNLFHGGKHGGDSCDNPPRMRVLLASTIGVLDDLADRGGFGGDYSGDY